MFSFFKSSSPPTEIYKLSNFRVSLSPSSKEEKPQFPTIRQHFIEYGYNYGNCPEIGINPEVEIPLVQKKESNSNNDSFLLDFSDPSSECQIYYENDSIRDGKAEILNLNKSTIGYIIYRKGEIIYSKISLPEKTKETERAGKEGEVKVIATRETTYQNRKMIHMTIKKEIETKTGLVCNSIDVHNFKEKKFSFSTPDSNLKISFLRDKVYAEFEVTQTTDRVIKTIGTLEYNWNFIDYIEDVTRVIRERIKDMKQRLPILGGIEDDCIGELKCYENNTIVKALFCSEKGVKDGIEFVRRYLTNNAIDFEYYHQNPKDRSFSCYNYWFLGEKVSKNYFEEMLAVVRGNIKSFLIPDLCCVVVSYFIYLIGKDSLSE